MSSADRTTPYRNVSRSLAGAGRRTIEATPESGDRLRLRRARLAGQIDLTGIVAVSEPMIRVLELVERVAGTEWPVLVTGDTGVGKRTLAHAIHVNSPHAHEPFVAEHAGALDVHSLGSAVGASDPGRTDRPCQAIGARGAGSLILENIGELPRDAQSLLLDRLRNRDNALHSPLPRVIATSSQPLERLVQEDVFDEQLYFALCVFPIHVPALSARRDDILPLARFLLARNADRKFATAPFHLTPDAVRALVGRAYDGNVAELQRILHRAAQSASDQEISARLIDHPPNGQNLLDRRAVPGSQKSGLWVLPHDGLDLEKLNRSLTEQALERTGHKVSPAARLLGLSRATLRYRIKKYGISLAD